MRIAYGPIGSRSSTAGSDVENWHEGPTDLRRAPYNNADTLALAASGKPVTVILDLCSPCTADPI